VTGSDDDNGAAAAGDDGSHDRGAGEATGPGIGYREALTELEQILRELDADDVDVDVLGAKVRRAAELLHLCRERIVGARFEVEQVVAGLPSDDDPEV
jgi:exodeoxyribonuclease VII small subunit